jgi:phosphohistidine phosphatase SixA
VGDHPQELEHQTGGEEHGDPARRATSTISPPTNDFSMPTGGASMSPTSVTLMRHGGDCIVAVVKPAAFALLDAVACLAPAPPAAAQEAIYIVRHAERADQSADSPLSTEGVGRAYKLRDMLKDAGINKIFTSELRRTIETAGPLALANHLTAQVLPGADVDGLAARVTATGAHDRVLVVAHSNTVPALLKALHVDATITIADDEYDNLFIVVPEKEGRPVLLRLKY